MTSFIVLAVLLGGVALAVLTRPLWSRARHDPAAADAQTLAQAREQLRQLDALRRSGALTDAQASEARTRLEQRVGEALARAPVAAPVERRSTHLLSSLSLFVVVIAVAGYATLGTPQALDPAARSARADSSHAITMEQIQGMADKLAARLKDQPNDPEGWAMLGRSYAVLGDAQRALGAFKQAMALRPDDAVLLADYADTLALANDRNLEGEPSRLIARALEIDPNNLKALSLAGTAAFMRKDYALALRHWEKMAQVAPDSDWVKQIQGGIDEARRLAAASGTAPPVTPSAAATKATTQAGGATVSGVVKLSTSLAGKAAPDDTLFVYARAAQGPRMPLAILRKQVKDLPLTFTLDDSMAMSPAAKLSSAQQVVVSARISKRGNAAPEPGDLQGQSAPVAPGASGLTIEIGQVVGP